MEFQSDMRKNDVALDGEKWSSLRPLWAVGSVSEPEAAGAIVAYPPACKPMAYKPTGWKRPRRDFGLRKWKTGRPGYKKDERPTSNIEWGKHVETVEYSRERGIEGEPFEVKIRLFR